MASEPLTIDAGEHQKLMDEWALAIGRFMVQFSECEYFTYQYIYTFGGTKLREEVTYWNLEDRTKKAREVVLAIGLIEAVEKRVIDACSKVLSLATTRNLVAHNGPMLHVYTNDEGKLLLEIELRSQKDDSKSITIKRLDELTEQTRELVLELSLLYGEVRQPKSHKKV
jgi:hypothetical protein